MSAQPSLFPEDDLRRGDALTYDGPLEDYQPAPKTKPVHVLAHWADSRSLCGLKDPLPRIWSPFVAAHVAGYGMVVCEKCEAHRAD